MELQDRIDARSVHSFTSADGIDRLHIFQRNDGLFDFWAEEQCVVQGDETFGSYTYWSTVVRSGLHASLKEAHAAAIAETPWLR
jgi:hypothetical protein